MSLSQILKSKTILFSLILAVLSVIQGYTGILPLTVEQQGLVGMLIAVAIAVLRVLTTTSVSEK